MAWWHLTPVGKDEISGCLVWARKHMLHAGHDSSGMAALNPRPTWTTLRLKRPHLQSSSALRSTIAEGSGCLEACDLCVEERFWTAVLDSLLAELADVIVSRLLRASAT